ncbi:glycosyltransferase family 2 protein [Primorskyibacter sp. 2E233]|uniref:glycosyltransferase family 2 protein n=1 Tax=Primorskyibacter sp. 2E233 TaxID=3413431 RepID=UPI003BF36A01
MSSQKPLVSLGLPVFNGEKYLPQAIDSILAQDFEEFELLICDNASSDRTEEICRAYQDVDRRVRVIRHEENIGAARNFNFTFEATEGPYFKWCACDDYLSPSYLGKVLELLKSEPGASLSHSQTQIVDSNCDELEIFVPEFVMLPDDPVDRMMQVFRHGQRCYEVFGVMRRETLENTGLIGNFRGGDNALLYRLAMLGTFEIVPEPLFHLRRHEEQSTAMVSDSQSYHTWFTGRKAKISFPDWQFLRETWAAPAGIKLPVEAKLRCFSALAGESYRRRRRLIQNLRVAGETMIFGGSDPKRRRRLFKRNS